jgi:hypothetical protein
LANGRRSTRARRAGLPARPGGPTGAAPRVGDDGHSDVRAGTVVRAVGPI